MNLKLRRLVHTPSSEQYALFDPDRTDANFDPLSIGKLDLHFTADGIYGTFLVWEQIIASMESDQVCALVEAALAEISEPMGLPAFYAVEFFAPDLDGYKLYTNEPEAEEDTEAEEGSPSD